MDVSGNNRYELLYMDDDSISTSKQGESEVSKKNCSNAIGKKPAPIIAKKNMNVEKENTSGALNKNIVGSKKLSAYQGKPKTSGQPGTSLTKNRILVGESRQVAFKSQNGERREQRNLRDGGELINEQRDQRVFRDRDNRGSPRNRDVYIRGKREFDRQSGSDKTGVKAIDKRDGAGAHNWGSVKQEINDINKTTTDADATLTDKEESSNEQISEQPAAQEAEEIKELTLDEWKALRGVRSKPQYNIRKPNEGEDTSQWKKMVVLNKKKEGESEEEFEYDPSMYPQRVGRLQRVVDIQFNFNDGRRGGGGFARGRGRGPRTIVDNKGHREEGDRQPRQSQNFGDRQQKRPIPNALKVDDESQFPTLS